MLYNACKCLITRLLRILTYESWFWREFLKRLLGGNLHVIALILFTQESNKQCIYHMSCAFCSYSFNCFFCGLEILVTYIHEKEKSSMSWHEMPKVIARKRKWSGVSTMGFIGTALFEEKKSEDDCSITVVAAVVSLCILL